MVVNSMSYARYDSYKDSGVDWLGAIPSDWQSKKLGILLTEFSKKNNPNLPLLSITRELGVITRDMDDQESNHNFIPDDLSGYKLLKEGQFGMNKMKAWQGSYGISKYTGIVSPAYYVFDVSNEIYPNFFNIAIRSKFYVDFFGSASDGVRIGQWDLNKTRMREIPFIFPSFEQQKKIYEFLSKKIKQIDQAIALKQQQIEKLNEYKQIVIQNAVTKGLNPNVPMKNSGVDWIGDIPEHWEVKKLKYLIDSKAGYAFPSQQFSQEGISVIRISELNINGSVDISNSPKLPFSFAKFLEEFCVVSGDILMAMTGGTIGKVSIYRENKKSLLNQRVCKFIVKASLDKKLFWHFCNSLYWKNYIDFKANGGAQPNISDNEIKKMYFPLPSISEQKTIANFLDEKTQNINQTIERYQTQIDRLKEYKNILINQAVTGKIKI